MRTENHVSLISRFVDWTLNSPSVYALPLAILHWQPITGSPQNNFKPHIIVERWRAVEWLLLNEPWNEVSKMDSALSFTSK
jgi:hypothetical protein